MAFQTSCAVVDVPTQLCCANWDPTTWFLAPFQNRFLFFQEESSKLINPVNQQNMKLKVARVTKVTENILLQ